MRARKPGGHIRMGICFDALSFLQSQTPQPCEWRKACLAGGLRQCPESRSFRIHGISRFPSFGLGSLAWASPTTPNQPAQALLPDMWLVAERDADRQRLGDKLAITLRCADYRRLDAEEPYIDFMLNLLNGSVFAVFFRSVVDGYVSCVGEELAQPPELQQPGEGTRFPHGFSPIRVTLRQRMFPGAARKIQEALSRADGGGLDIRFWERGCVDQRGRGIAW